MAANSSRANCSCPLKCSSSSGSTSATAGFEHLTDFIIVRLTRDLAEQFPVRMILHLSENYVFDRVYFRCLVGKSVGSHPSWYSAEPWLCDFRCIIRVHAE